MIEIDQSRSDLAYQILVLNSDWMNKNNIDLWRKPYPRDLFEVAINAREVYGAQMKGVLIGTVTLSNDLPSYCPPTTWPQVSKPFWYLSRLAVDPQFRGRGFGGQFLELIEESAIKKGINKIRLDCAKKVKFLSEYYTNAGFTFQGEAVFMEFRVNLFEKELR